MASRRLKALSGDRLNPERVATLSVCNPEILRLLALANGMEVFLDPEFRPNGASSATRPKLRQKYTQTAKAVNCVLYRLVEAGLAFILPMEVAENSWNTCQSCALGRRCWQGTGPSPY
jgi:hypothetical protein